MCPENAIESIVAAAYRSGGDPTQGVEPFLGNDLRAKVAILGFNPGTNGPLHRISAPITTEDMSRALMYFRGYLNGADFSQDEFADVWSRYCWLLNPGHPTYPQDKSGFCKLATEQLLVVNLHQSQSDGEQTLPHEARDRKGEVAHRILGVAAQPPQALVVQGEKAWRWVRKHTKPIDRVRHLPPEMSRIYLEQPVGSVGYTVEFCTAPNIRIAVLPVFHLTGKEWFRSRKMPWSLFAEMEARYRNELNALS